MKHKHALYLAIVAIFILLIISLVLLATPVNAYDGERVTTRRQDALHEAAEILRAAGFTDDDPEVAALSAAWWEEQEDLDIVAKVIQNEADPKWCEWEHSVAVGVVILNRVKCPYFKGDTVKEIVAAPGQYLKSYTYNFEKTSRLAYLAAKAAIDGEHGVPSNAYWQDNKIQGCYIWKSFLLDTGWYRSTTYICCGIPGVD